MKRLISVFVFGALFMLVACGGGDSESEGGGETPQKAEGEMKVGETKDTDEGTITLHKRWDDGETFETGPIVLTVDKVFTSSGDMKGDAAELIGEHVEYIQVNISVENTSEDDITFYAGQGTVATNTGEQLEADILLSDYIDGNMLAGTKASGSFFYMLENSSAKDIESIRMKFSAPHETESFDDVGEELDFEINLQ